MEQRFRLQAHEVWRGGLVRDGQYAQSEDFRGVLASDVWPKSRFVFGRYRPSGREDSRVGHILFRPEQGPQTENFFCAVDVYGDSIRADDASFCKLGEFVFGGEHVDLAQIQRALARGLWGRVFYLKEQMLREEGDIIPCDWGVFLGAGGLGLWKWTMRDGVTWGKASSDGLFRWHENPVEAARFLARTPSAEIWARLQAQMENPRSDAAFSRRWLQTEEEARLDEVARWKNGSPTECEAVLKFLLLTEPELESARHIELTTTMFADEFDEDRYMHELQADDHRRGFSARFQRAEATLRSYFKAEIPEELPLCAQNSYLDKWITCRITEPTAHERLEAQLLLRSWAKERGLSFD